MGNSSAAGLCRCDGSACFGGERDSNAVGTILDDAVTQSRLNHHRASDVTTCALYDFVDYDNAGLLINVYNKEGLRGVERVVRDSKFQCSIYETGNNVVSMREINRWRRMNHCKQLSSKMTGKTMESMPVPKPDPLNTLEEHQACWKLNCRGMMGESILHCLLICNTPVHASIAKKVLSIVPKFSLDLIEGDEYFGVSALHLSIAYNQLDLVKALVERGAKVNQRATGRFFRPSDQQFFPHKSTDYEALCYMGEYPLAWAACCGNESAYNYLIDHNADPNLQDSYGNSILHMLVINDMQEMYGFALRHPKKPASHNIVNNMGLTPLTMACKLGRNDIFRSMLELSALEFWRYSNITCAGYPLNALDSILPNGKINWNSALMIILSGKKEQHLDMLNGGVIQRLLEEKWKTFARTEFIKKLGLLCLHLFTLILAIWFRPAYTQPLIGATDTKSIIRYCAEIGSCIGCLSYLVFQQGSELVAQGIIGFFFNLTSSPPKTLFLFSNILLLMCIPVRIFGSRTTEDMLLSLVLPSSWFFLMFFAGAVRLTGPFVTMIYQMLTGDMLRFGIILSIFLLGFSQAFFFLYKTYSTPHTAYGTYPDTWMALLHMMLGEYEFTDLNETKYDGLTKTVFAIFMILMPILLLNMLIAMMGNTYLQIITRSEKEWMKQWASIVLNLERSLDKKTAKHHMHTYSIKCTTDEQDPDMEQRAVMVIKSKSKTKAKQRKGALVNWKRIGKKTIEEVKRRGGTARQFYEYENEMQGSTSSRKISRGSNMSDFDDTDAGSTMLDKIGDTLNQLAWANNINISAINSARFAEPQTTTINGFIPTDHVHPGQEVAQRAFSDPKKEISPPPDPGLNHEQGLKKVAKRKRKKNFLKSHNKVGVASLVKGCIDNVVDTVEIGCSNRIDESKEPGDSDSSISPSRISQNSSSALLTSKPVLSPLKPAELSKISDRKSHSSPGRRKFRNRERAISTISADVDKCTLKSPSRRLSEPTSSTRPKGEVCIRVDDDTTRVRGSHVVDVDADVHPTPGSSKSDDQSPFVSRKEKGKMSNWSTKQVIPISELCQWDNVSDS